MYPLLLAAVLADPMAAGRLEWQRFSQGDDAALWADMSPELRQAFKSREGMSAALAATRRSLGQETKLLDERTVPAAGATTYERTAWHDHEPEAATFSFAFDGRGRLAGFHVRANTAYEANTAFLGYRTRTRLRAPFRGTWTVFWGGRKVIDNYHAAYEDQRFAYDLLVMKDGESHVGDGKQLAQYHCYGQPVLAPAGAVVIEAVADLPDNQPGQLDGEHAAGNHVVLDFGNGEYGLLAHMQPRSLKVKLGDKVKAGQVLGLCGNSGNTSEPHLHFHLQDSPKLFEGHGLPATFTDVLLDGKPADRAEPVRGDTIGPR